MQTVLFRIWTWIVESTSYDNNCSTTRISYPLNKVRKEKKKGGGGLSKKKKKPLNFMNKKNLKKKKKAYITFASYLLSGHCLMPSIQTEKVGFPPRIWCKASVKIFWLVFTSVKGFFKTRPTSPSSSLLWGMQL